MAFLDSRFLKRENVEWSGDGSTKDNPRNFFKGDSVVNLAFQFRVRVDMKPFLQEQAFEQQQGRVCIGALFAGAGQIMPNQDGVYAHPVNGFVNVSKAC